MPTFADAVLPNTTGLTIGNSQQLWDINVRNLTVFGNVLGVVFPTGNGNAVAIQGTLVDPTSPLSGQVLQYNGSELVWVTIPTGNATQIQGRNVLTNVPADQQALVWSAASNAWLPQNQVGGGGGASLGYVVTGFSSTPIFTPSPVGSCGFQITLTGNVTSSTFNTSGLSAGQLFKFIVIQDGTGGHAFSWPSQCAVKPIIGGAASQTSVQSYIWNGTQLIPDSLIVIYP